MTIEAPRAKSPRNPLNISQRHEHIELKSAEAKRRRTKTGRKQKIRQTKNGLGHITSIALSGINSYLVVVLTLSLVFVCLVSQVVKLNYPSLLTRALIQTAYMPDAASLHLQLANLYLTAKRLSSAKEELAVGKSLLEKNQPENANQYQQLAYQIFDLPQQQQQQIRFWQKQVQLYPKYTDAWIQLLYLSYNQNDRDTVNNCHAKIAELDPNLAKKMAQLFKLPQN